MSYPYEVKQNAEDGKFYVEGIGCYIGPFEDQDLAGSVACALESVYDTGYNDGHENGYSSGLNNEQYLYL